MINNEILNFIKDRRAQGETKEQVTDMLVTHGGWDAKDVEEAYEAMEMSNASMPAALDSVEKEIMQTISPAKEPEIKTPAVAPVEESKPAPLHIAPTPVTLAPKAAEPASSVSGMKSASIFAMMPKTEPEKKLEPTIKPSVHAPELFVPAEPQVQKVETPTPTEPVSVPVEDEKTLKELRARFMEGRIVSPSVSPASEIKSTKPEAPLPVTPTPKAAEPAPVVSGGIGFPKTAPAAHGLFSHSQPIMTPTESAPINVAAPAASAVPVAAASTNQAAPATRPFGGFSPGQKVSVMSPGNLAQQKLPSAQSFVQPKAPGRKLLSFFMFAIGVTCGAVAMHAYLNGFIDPAIQWVMATMKSLGL